MTYRLYCCWREVMPDEPGLICSRFFFCCTFAVNTDFAVFLFGGERGVVDGAEAFFGGGVFQKVQVDHLGCYGAFEGTAADGAGQFVAFFIGVGEDQRLPAAFAAELFQYKIGEMAEVAFAAGIDC